MKKSTPKRIATSEPVAFSNAEINSQVAQRLVIWARENRLVLSHVTVSEGADGLVAFAIASDLSTVGSAPALANPPDARDAYQRFGGPALKRLLKDEEDALSNEIVED